MQSQMDNLGFTNAFIGTVEGEPEDTECQAVIAKVKDAVSFFLQDTSEKVRRYC